MIPGKETGMRYMPGERCHVEHIIEDGSYRAPTDEETKTLGLSLVKNEDGDQVYQTTVREEAPRQRRRSPRNPEE